MPDPVLVRRAQLAVLDLIDEHWAKTLPTGIFSSLKVFLRLGDSLLDLANPLLYRLSLADLGRQGQRTKIGKMGNFFDNADDPGR